MQIPSYGNELTFTCKKNFYPYEWFFTWPQFEKEDKSNSELNGLFHRGCVKAVVNSGCPLRKLVSIKLFFAQNQVLIGR